jgi:hypothetical protein
MDSADQAGTPLAPIPSSGRLKMGHHVTGLFSGPDDAKRAFELLVEANFDPSGISVVQMVDGDTKEVDIDHKTGVPLGARIGIPIGAGLGVATAFALAAPGVLVAGPIAVALEGALVGTAGGGLLGALGGLAFWWDEPDFGDEQGKEGVLVGVEVEGERADIARRELERAAALRIFG